MKPNLQKLLNENFEIIQQREAIIILEKGNLRVIYNKYIDKEIDRFKINNVDYDDVWEIKKMVA